MNRELLSRTKADLKQEIVHLSIGIDDFAEYLSGKRIILACSGGADSLALLLIFYAYEIDYSVCYVEHGLNEATKEASTYLMDLCEQISIPFFEVALDMSQKEKESNIESNARTKRYEALEQLRKTHHYDLIATAHHMDDVAETFLINLIRGSGSGGASLARSREKIVRPLLDVRKADLEKLVAYAELNPIVDPSNEELIFVRNRIRHEAIPLLNDISQRDVTELIARASDHIREDSELLNELAISQWPKDNPTTKSLQQLPVVLQKHAIRNWVKGYAPSSEEMDRILQIVNHEIKATQLSGNRTIRRSSGVLYQDITDTNL